MMTKQAEQAELEILKEIQKLLLKISALAEQLEDSYVKSCLLSETQGKHGGWVGQFLRDEVDATIREYEREE